jgi:hypothetical protein
LDPGQRGSTDSKADTARARKDAGAAKDAITNKKSNEAAKHEEFEAQRKARGSVHELVEKKKGAEEIEKKAPKPVFADAQAMKEKLRQNLGRPEYNVANFYHQKGIWQLIARDQYFENLTLSIIAMNALWIAVDTDNNDADMYLDAEVVFQIAENLFCVYFTFEWLVRFLSFKRKRDGLKDNWFIFDSFLVIISVAETWCMTLFIYGSSSGGSGGGLGNAGVLKLFRLVRLSRMARMARLFKAMPELMIMIKGMRVAMRSVFFTLCLLVCIVYVFAIAFVQLMGPRGALQPLSDEWFEEAGGFFPTVSKAMVTLLLGGTMPDEAALIVPVGAEHPIMWILIMMFILLAGLTVMNMLVGVLCEVVSVVSSVEKEALLVNFVKNQLQEMLVETGIDADGDNNISKGEFDALLEKPEAARALQEVGVDVVGLVDYSDFIFNKGAELTFGDFMDVVLQLRGSNTATVKDIVDLRKLVATEMSSMNTQAGQIIAMMKEDL